MSSSPRAAGLQTQPTGRFTSGRQIFENILKCLAILLQLTADEQRAAGIYLGSQNYK